MDLLAIKMNQNIPDGWCPYIVLRDCEAGKHIAPLQICGITREFNFHFKYKCKTDPSGCYFLSENKKKFLKS